MKTLTLVLAFVLVAFASAACTKSPTAPTDTPIITSFTADALSVSSGTIVTLSWDVATTSAEVRIDPLVGNVPVLGSTKVVLIATTTFTLNARVPSGAAAQRVLTVVVK